MGTTGTAGTAGTAADAPAARVDGALLAVVALTWLATRVIAVVSVDLTPWILDDVDLYSEWVPFLRDGVFPAADVRWQYPPGSGAVFLLVDALPMTTRWAFTLVILTADALTMGALLWARATRPDSRWRGPWLWALAGLLVGPIMITRFDLVPTLFAVGAVLLVARPVLSGASAALGFTVKLWPALMLLVLPRRSLPRGIVGFLITAAAVIVGFALMFRESLSFLANQQDRGLQVESVGALPYLVHDVTGGDVAFGYVYGSFQVLMAGTETVGLIVTVIGAVLMLVLVVSRLAGRLEHVAPGDVALATMLVAVATSRVYSPQFNVWLVGIAAVALLDSRSRARAAAAFVVVASLLTQVVYPWSATQLLSGETLIVVVQGLRIAALLTALVLALFAVLRSPRPSTTGPVPVVG